jgi:hypothetical protein
MKRLCAFAIVVVLSGASSSCIDPVHSDDVSALGPEEQGVREGPTHRPGQPCRACHGGQGPGKPEFTIAGTVYLSRGSGLPAVGTTVEISDSTNSMVLKTLVTNEVGNFYISTDDWKPGPTFPLFIRLRDGRADVAGVKEMQTPIGRNGGCAFCHYGDDLQPSHMPPVFLRTEPLK